MNALAEPFTMSIDDLWPRDPEHRYRIYAVVGDERTVLAAASTPQGVGLALVTLHEDEVLIGRRLSDLGRIGVLDTMPGGQPGLDGDWIVLPYERRPA